MTALALLFGTILAAGKPCPAGVEPVTWTHLVRCEAVLKSAKNFRCSATKTVARTAGMRKGITTQTVAVIWQRPCKTRVNVTAVPAPRKETGPPGYEAYILTDRYCLEYRGFDRTLTETRFQEPTQLKGFFLLDVLAGEVTAERAIEQYDITLIKVDTHYLYLQLVPRERNEHLEAKVVVLFRDIAGQPGYLPRQVVIRRRVNQEEETWAFANPAINVGGIRDQDFDPVPVDPPTWKHIVVDGKQRTLGR